MPQTIHDNTRHEVRENIPPTEEHNPHVNTVNYFSELSIAEEEDNTEAFFVIKNFYNTISKGVTSQDIPPSTSNPNIGKTTLPKEKIIPEFEYNLVDDLKRDKENISL